MQSLGDRSGRVVEVVLPINEATLRAAVAAVQDFLNNIPILSIPGLQAAIDGKVGRAFDTLSRAPTSADVPEGQQRMIFRTDTNTPEWWWNVDGTLVNILAPKQF
ncbi:hypothetical protein SB3_29505 [Methylobacterium radiotolerans]|nr:hypothetical protein SB3_29505 [Methylobacterium radiotolerans]